MRVFVTGATGFVGSAVVRELLGAGHRVLGLARSDAAAATLAAAGAEVHRGTLEDLDSLRAGAASADGVVHAAFIHDFTDFGHSVAVDLRAVETLVETLAGTDRPFVLSSGTPGGAGGTATEDTVPGSGTPAAARLGAEEAVLAFAGRGVRGSVVRLPRSVHGEGDHHGFVARLIDIARERGVSAYPGDGANAWPAVHRLDAAVLYRLALEQAPAGSRLHAVGDEGIPVRRIAERIGEHLGLPVTSVPVEAAAEHFGWLGPIFAMDTPASSTRTRKLLDWHPARPGLLADIDAGHYFAR
ncbi:SDR family oxidoreductase [Amycolatopsis rifamycinica]|uniref:3-beta hydroxysteroid dehydrogenase n=1 Tax=Amycolatopsis rifamycinica TaxID=287986 RepID=A0A066U494_9PSEU|nr:SDR family oxidoreductase [Amycolatopsis rifamycinica]KDN18949.1 3-beta hydroxysteroid dehydrogenase [Amycolatopsis rifamycinica]